MIKNSGATTWPCYILICVITWCVIKGLHCIYTMLMTNNMQKRIVELYEQITIRAKSFVFLRKCDLLYENQLLWKIVTLWNVIMSSDLKPERTCFFLFCFFNYLKSHKKSLVFIKEKSQENFADPDQTATKEKTDMGLLYANNFYQTLSNNPKLILEKWCLKLQNTNACSISFLIHILVFIWSSWDSFRLGNKFRHTINKQFQIFTEYQFFLN